MVRPQLNTVMRIGTLELANNTVMAPLAGITNLPFRLMAKEAGCGLVCSEMISAHGLIRNSNKTKQIMDSTLEEKPLSIQLFGSDPDITAAAAEIITSAEADIVDINFGCSVRKIVKTGSGVALMREPSKAQKLLKAVRKATQLPLTIKIRSGWDATGEQAVNIARIAEDCGVDGITVHPRTASQGFAGRAAWPIIGTVKTQVSIPVIGNGDIFDAKDAIEMMATTGCDGVMIGRGAIGYPWIFSQVLALMRGENAPEIDVSLRFKSMERYLRASVKYLGETRACYMMRSRLGWFAKGLPHSSRFRESIKMMSTESQAIDLIRTYREQLLNRVHLKT